MLWPDVDDERARGNLRQRLLRLKRMAGTQLLIGDAQVQLAAGIGHDLADTHELLETVDPEAASGFAEWLTAQRARRRRARCDALATSAAQAEAQGDLASALQQAGALLDLDPLSEEAHRRLIKLHYLRGDTGAALAAYRRCADALQSELGAEPSRETRELKRQIEQAAPVVPVAKAPRALPVTILRPPRLIGRESELAAMAQAWEAGVAFLLQGEAGMGKSRALAEFAHEHARVILMQARPGDSGVPYATLARLLRTAMAGKFPELPDGSRTQLARVLPELQPAPAAPVEGAAAAVAAGDRGGAARGAARRRARHPAGRPAVRRRGERGDAAHDSRRRARDRPALGLRAAPRRADRRDAGAARHAGGRVRIEHGGAGAARRGADGRAGGFARPARLRRADDCGAAGAAHGRQSDVCAGDAEARTGGRRHRCTGCRGRPAWVR